MIADLLREFTGKRVLVLGDVMLDHYVWGRVERISPEAPVPVLEAQSEEHRLGGAANVALNVRSLGAQVELVGVAGNDRPSELLTEMLTREGMGHSGLLRSDERSTTVKTRIGAVNQQIVRIDYETKSELSPALSSQILAAVERLLPGCAALIIEDYNKGLLTAAVIAGVLELARRNGIPVAVDPKQKNFMAYRGVEIFKPNHKELQTALGKALESDAEFFAAARELRQDLQTRNLIVTRGARGMYVFGGDGQPRHLPTYAREVYDVSGAGDTVISALTLAWICSGDIQLAAEVANHAAGIVCGIKGTARVSPKELLASYNEPR